MEILVKIKYDASDPNKVDVITTINDCESQVTPTPTSSIKPTPTQTPSPTPTLTQTPKPTSTIQPSSTPTPTATIPNGLIQYTKEFYEGIVKGSLILESDKTYLVDYIKTTPIYSKLKITTTGKLPATLIIGKENYLAYTNTQAGYLFDVRNGAEIIIDNVNFTQPKQIVSSQPFMPSLFNSVQDENAVWTILIKNYNNAAIARNGGFGLGFLYGGKPGNYVGLINVKHVGPSLMDLKNPYGGGVMYLVMENVDADYKNPYEWGTNKLLIKGKVNTNNTFTITRGGTIQFLYNHYFTTDVVSNMSFLAHVGRFTFMIDTIGSVIDSYNFKLRPAPKDGDKVVIKRDGTTPRAFFVGKEPHAGDKFVINGITYTIVQKNRTYVTDWTTWGDQYNKELAYQLACFTDISLPIDGEYVLSSYVSSFNLTDIEQPAYLIYKGNYDFRTYSNTKFEDNEVLSGPVVAHQCYNHSTISMWDKNAKLIGYYRQTNNGDGNTLGFNMINCEGFSPEFNPPVAVTNDPNLPMPARIKDLLATL